MPTLLDSNILLRTAHRGDPNHALVRQALRTLRLQNETLCYTSQNIGEFWNVCTRPAEARGGLGLSVAETERRVQLIERLFVFLPDSAAVHQTWRRLLVDHAVQGVQVHDARLAAAMLVHNVGRLLTMDTKDFARYGAIRVVHPRDI